MDKIRAVTGIRDRLGVSLRVAKEIYENSEISLVIVVSENPLTGYRTGFANNYVDYDEAHNWTSHEEGGSRLCCSHTETHLATLP